MATVAVGDIHGNIRALDDLLARIEQVIESEDTVVFLGDYIDRGPDAKRCIDRILAFRADVSATVVTLMGNHEDWLLRSLRDSTRHSWLMGMEASETIFSYSPEAARLLRAALEDAGPRLLTERVSLPYQAFFDVVPRAHLDFLQGLKLYHLSADAVCVHGGLDPGVSEVEAQPRETLLWGTDDFPEGYRGEDTVVYGHWDNASVNAEGWPEPRIRNHSIGIDTISHGVLTAVWLPDLRVVQSGRYVIPPPRG
jgi:serine/threonine protein phosphatase 1